MKKAYIVPTAKYINLAFEGLVAQSLQRGVKSGADVGDDYTSTDVSYSNRRTNIWGEKY